MHAALVVTAYTALFCWPFWVPLSTGRLIADLDLFDWFLPIFLSPIATWSHDMFAGLPLFADTSDSQAYIVHFLFAHVFKSWVGYIMAGYVLAASLMYSYVYSVTRSRTAAAVAGLAYALSHGMLTRVAHINFVHAAAWFPLLMLAVDRVLQGDRGRWIAIGAFAEASTFLAGHPQPAFYTTSFAMAYALTGGISQRVDRRTWGGLVALVVLGVALTALKAVPFLEVSTLMARQAVSYAAFIQPAQTLRSLSGVLLAPGHLETVPLYVGIPVLALAFIAVGSRSYCWRAWFWAVGASFVFLVVAGDVTPIAALVYHIPVMKDFQLTSRMLFVFSAAATVLAGFAVAEFQQHRMSRRVPVIALTIFGLLFAAAVLLVGRGPTPLPVAAVTESLLILVTSGLVIGWMAWGRKFQGAIVALLVLVVADLLVISAPHEWRPGYRGLSFTTIDRAAVAPSVHALALRRRLNATHQRFLAVGGADRDLNVPGGFSRLWRIPTAGGFSPIMLQRLAALARMGGPGDVYPEALDVTSHGLDLLAVRYVVVADIDFLPDSTLLQRAGLPWASPRLDLPVGPPPCSYRGDRELTLPVASGFTLAAVAAVVGTRCAEKVPAETVVGTLSIETDQGVVHEHRVRVGADTLVGERFEDPDVSAPRSMLRLDLKQPLTGARVVFKTPAGSPALVVERLTLIDDAGKPVPQTAGRLFLQKEERWRAVATYRTGKETDRGRDVDVASETGYVLYENLRAMPRARLVFSRVALSDEEATAAVRYSYFPDGRRYDPVTTAIVEAGADTSPLPSARGEARVTAIDNGRITIDVDAAAPAYLVVSEAFYPGWRATIDGERVDLDRADLMFIGLPVPGGKHTVTLEMVSTTLRIGIAISIAALAATLWLLLRGRPVTIEDSPSTPVA